MLETFDTILGFAAVMLTLSLLITACVQVASAFFRLRCGSLAWGLRQMFEQLELPPDEAALLARRVVDEVPVLKSGSRWLFGQGAQAVTPAELTKILRGIAAGRFPDQNQPSQALTNWLQHMGAHRAADGHVATHLPEIATELGKLFPAQAQAAREAVERVVHRGDVLAARVDDWFDSAMARAADRFALMTRYWTVFLSALLVVVMQVDATHIYATLRADDALRSQWLARVDPLVAQAEKALQGRPCEFPAGTALQALIDDLATDAAADKAIENALKAAQPAPASPADGRRLLDKVGLATQTDAFLAHYDTTARQCFGEALAAVKKQADAMQQDTSLLTNPDVWKSANGLLGMLLAAVLLSLGAPFWFNLLKNLASLRPVIAARAGDAGHDAGRKPAS
jgi:hypothetical protein